MATIKFQGTMKELAEYAASCDPNIFVLLEYNTDEDCNTYVDGLKEEGCDAYRVVFSEVTKYDMDKADSAVKKAFDYLCKLNTLRSHYDIYKDLHHIISCSIDVERKPNVINSCLNDETIDIIKANYAHNDVCNTIDQLNIIFYNVSYQGMLSCLKIILMGLYMESY